MKKKASGTGNKRELAKTELARLGKRIKQLRMERGYTNYENFAYDHGISRAQFGRYEQGENLQYLSLLKIVKAFDISLEEFFSEGFDT